MDSNHRPQAQGPLLSPLSYPAKHLTSTADNSETPSATHHTHSQSPTPCMTSRHPRRIPSDESHHWSATPTHEATLPHSQLSLPPKSDDGYFQSIPAGMKISPHEQPAQPGMPTPDRAEQECKRTRPLSTSYPYPFSKMTVNQTKRHPQASNVPEQTTRNPMQPARKSFLPPSTPSNGPSEAGQKLIGIRKGYSKESRDAGGPVWFDFRPGHTRIAHSRCLIDLPTLSTHQLSVLTALASSPIEHTAPQSPTKRLQTLPNHGALVLMADRTRLKTRPHPLKVQMFQRLEVIRPHNFQQLEVIRRRQLPAFRPEST